jgi:hypothetical protein
VSVTCPDGHTSEATDFCDVCGAPIAASAPPAGSTDAAAATTGPVPSTSPPPPAPAAPPPPSPTAGGTTTPATTAPGAAGTTICPSCGTAISTEALFCEGCGRDMVTGQEPGPSTTAPDATEPTPAARASTGWVAEVWVDEEWFAVRGEGRCPTVGAPRTFPVDDGSLIGRHSRSRGITPDVDCSGDGSVSGRQATLGFDGTRWTVTDLGSTNGTFVAHAGAAAPADPIAPNTAVELEPGDRILIGAHTRVVVRAETQAEVDARTP